MRSMRTVLKGALDVVLVLCAITTTLVFVVRGSSSQPTVTDGATRFAGWKEDLAFARRIGAGDAPYRLVVWTDYQCPACMQFEQELETVRGQLKDSLAVVYRYNPLPIHPLAFRAAVAAECARAQGRFEGMHRALFAAQLHGDSLPVAALASASAIPDTSAFRRCLADSTSAVVADVRADVSRAHTLHLRGTPGVQVGDRVATGGMPADELLPRLREARRRAGA